MMAQTVSLSYLWKTAHKNETVCFDQSLHRKDYKHFRANIAFNISRMFQSLVKGIAQHSFRP